MILILVGSKNRNSKNQDEISYILLATAWRKSGLLRNVDHYVLDNDFRNYFRIEINIYET
jgi:hypothetical protein